MSKEVKIELAFSILESLWIKGLLTDEEFNKAKDKIAITLSL